jgi:hypothetical protein
MGFCILRRSASPAYEGGESMRSCALLVITRIAPGPGGHVGIPQRDGPRCKSPLGSSLRGVSPRIMNGKLASAAGFDSPGALSREDALTSPPARRHSPAREPASHGARGLVSNKAELAGGRKGPFVESDSVPAIQPFRRVTEIAWHCDCQHRSGYSAVPIPRESVQLQCRDCSGRRRCCGP